MIHVIPGMGADHTMYRDDWLMLEDCRFHDWPAYRGETSLHAIAGRLVSEAGVRDGDVLIGHSLGGMVACEAASLRKLRCLILLGSARRKEDVSTLLAALHPLAAITPFRLAQTVAGKLPGDLYEMFVRADADFIRASCRAIFEWEGLGDTPAPVYRIHGRHDLVIPLPDDADHIVEGGHMIPMTHARDCVKRVRRCIAESATAT